jgi:hypothetical protein
MGPASARLLLSSVVGAEEISYDNVVGILKESQQLLEANRQLQKQRASCSASPRSCARPTPSCRPWTSAKTSFCTP